ncbi:MAG: M48 family metalloprotease [Planctomycetota bacterium]
MNKLFLVLLGFNLLFCSCEFLTQQAQNQGVINENQANAARTTGEGISELTKETSLKDERDLGETVALQAYATPEFGKPLKNENVMRYLALVTTHIGRHSDRPLIPYFTAVVNSDEVNAFATPGGYIFITRGAIEIMQSEAELAAVIGHEIAHINKKHALNAIQRIKGTTKILSGAAKGANMGDSPEFDGFVKDLAKMIMGSAFGKGDELDADITGIKYAMASGYDARAMIDFLNTLKSRAVHAGAVTSSHPSPDDRIAELNKYFSSLPKDEWQGLVKQTNRFDKIKEMMKQSESW